MRLPFAPILSLSLFLFLPPATAPAAEPYFKKGDVIALVGGEDMVVASEYGYLEFFLIRALPDYHLRFRNLAWEGDTAFEQHRELNFPTWEEQLDKVGATVVIAQFGQMESLAGKEKLPEFVAVYEKLIERFSGGGKRRLIVVLPADFEPAPSIGPDAVVAQNQVLQAYRDALQKTAGKLGAGIVSFQISLAASDGDFGRRYTRDGSHLAEWAHRRVAKQPVSSIVVGSDRTLTLTDAMKRIELSVHPTLGIMEPKVRDLHSLIIAKNRLWFDYWRPQNWAFLAGDRTNQPSSRDHVDPSKRWFPPEREQFLPLIEAKEKEIDALAAKLAKP